MEVGRLPWGRRNCAFFAEKAAARLGKQAVTYRHRSSSKRRRHSPQVTRCFVRLTSVFRQILSSNPFVSCHVRLCREATEIMRPLVFTILQESEARGLLYPNRTVQLFGGTAACSETLLVLENRSPAPQIWEACIYELNLLAAVN